MNTATWRKKAQPLLAAAKRYRWVLLVLAVGLLLLCLPRSARQETTQQRETAFSLAEEEARLARALSRIQGVGEVTVMLTLQAGPEQVLAQESRLSESADHREEDRAPVVLSGGSGRQETVLLRELSPRYQGMLIVCPGAEEPALCLKLTRAAMALTGLGADKIAICKGK